MNRTNALFSLLVFLVVSVSIYYMYNRGNIAFFFGETTKLNAQIDSIKLVRGLAGRAWNQQVYFSYHYKNQSYSSYFRNDATRWNLISPQDSLQIKISTDDPNHTKVIGVYFTNKQNQNNK
jgi:hypothetical protein